MVNSGNTATGMRDGTGPHSIWTTTKHRCKLWRHKRLLRMHQNRESGAGGRVKVSLNSAEAPRSSCGPTIRSGRLRSVIMGRRSGASRWRSRRMIRDLVQITLDDRTCLILDSNPIPAACVRCLTCRLKGLSAYEGTTESHLLREKESTKIGKGGGRRLGCLHQDIRK